MTVGRAITTIICSTLLLAVIGGSFGYGLGTLAPGYYRSVFRSSQEPGFDPVGVGVGLGLTQGTTAGVIVGLVLVALICWRDTRLDSNSSSPQAGKSVVSPRSAPWILFVTGSLLTLAFCLFAGFMVGLLMGEEGAYHRQYLEERAALSPVLSTDPAFVGVEVHEYSGGGAYLSGYVPTAVDLDRLRDVVVHSIGESRAKHALLTVHARQ